MPYRVERHFATTGPLTITATPSAPIPYGASALGVVFVEAVSGATLLRWHASHSAESAAAPLYVGDTPVTTAITAGRAIPVPDAAAAAPFVRVSTDSGTASIVLAVKG